jgi:hypothetical protein
MSEWKLAIRWIGPDAELGLAANTLTIFGDGTLHGVSAASAPQTIDVNTNGALAGIGSLNCQDVIIKEIEALDFCLTDEEIAARLA